LNSYGTPDVTDKEMEDYHLKKKRFDDPMREFVKSQV